jgi:nickel-dependent lactate racemase
MGWCDDLTGAPAQVKVEVHEPANRKRLSYLATTRRGQRLYLNRTIVEADQLVVVTGRRYDALLGYGGAEGALYPTFADEDTHARRWERLSSAAPGPLPWPMRSEAAEACWLLGVPFMVQVIEGTGTEIAHVLGGTPESSAEGARLLDERWRSKIDEPVDTVVAAASGGPGRPDFVDMAQALATAARVVKPDGRIFLWGRLNPELGPSAEMLRRAGDPVRGLAELREAAPTDVEAGYQWASTVQRARVYMLSGLPEETAEELFTVPLEHPGQLRRLIGSDGNCLVIADANKALVVPRGQGSAGRQRRKSR